MILAALAFALACGPRQPEPKQPAPELPLPKPNIDPGRLPPKEPVPPTAASQPDPYDTIRPVVPPDAAFAQGWMPLVSTGVNDFLQSHPTFDGRGVVIGILDTGIDPGIPGLSRTSTDSPKLLDLRDFSDEGAVPLRRITPVGDSVEFAGRRLRGFGRVAALNTQGPYYAGLISELPLGPPPASDLNGNGTVGDSLILVVTRASDGWVVFADTDGDGSFTGERPVHDYLVARESFGWAQRGRTPRITLAANFSGGAAEPRLRHQRSRLACRRNRRGERSLRRRRVRRRGARRTAARSQDRQQRPRQRHDHRKHDARGGLCHPVCRGAPASPGLEHELRGGQ
jgi:hypothetical protein